MLTESCVTYTTHSGKEPMLRRVVIAELLLRVTYTTGSCSRVTCYVYDR